MYVKPNIFGLELGDLWQVLAWCKSIQAKCSVENALNGIPKAPNNGKILGGRIALQSAVAIFDQLFSHLQNILVAQASVQHIRVFFMVSVAIFF